MIVVKIHEYPPSIAHWKENLQSIRFDTDYEHIPLLVMAYLGFGRQGFSMTQIDNSSEASGERTCLQQHLI